MKVNKDLILSIIFNDLGLSFYKLKTIRGSHIFFDEESNFYGSWDDLWHVLSHLSSDSDYHWTRLQPTYISKDFRRLIVNNLNSHKRSIPLENIDKHMQFWDLWEQVLFDDESTIEVDLTGIGNKHLRYVTLDYNSINDGEHLYSLIEKLNDHKNKMMEVMNLSNGKKIKSFSNEKLSEIAIMPGDTIKVEYKI